MSVATAVAPSNASPVPHLRRWFEVQVERHDGTWVQLLETDDLQEASTISNNCVEYGAYAFATVVEIAAPSE